MSKNEYGDKLESIDFSSTPKRVDSKEPVNTPKEEVVKTETVEVKPEVKPVVTNNYTKKPEPNKPSSQIVNRLAPESKITGLMIQYTSAQAKAKNYKEQGAATYMFFNVFKVLLVETDHQTFRRDWTMMLNYVNENSKAISALTAFLGVSAWPGTSQDFDIYRKLIVLVLETANPDKRFKKLTSIDSATLLNGISGLPKGANARDRLTAYYNL